MDENKDVVVETETVETPDTGIETLRAELERLKAENGKLKSAQSNASADASKYKKALQERMTAQEREAAETKELIEQLKAKNAALERSQLLAEQETMYVGLGFDSATAKRAAAAFYDRDSNSLAESIRDFITAHDKALAADAVRNTPRPGVSAGEPAAKVTKEQFEKMGYSDRVKLYNEDPELYNNLSGKE